MENKKIIIAEDSKYIGIAYKDGLEHAGFDVVLVSNGAEAIQMIRSERPDIILLDMLMPVKSCVEVLREINEDEVLKDIPVVVLTNFSEETEAEEVMELGAVDYIVKLDLSMAEVVERIKVVLSKKE